ncbi:MAG: hypothetical protein SWQ30_06160 [Thermodesulfobacteriota bacterium]|nr:hypothetical protein [Thermodesulfobacteriota bacterium]
MKRPSNKELSKKIREARDAAGKGQIAILNQVVISCDALELGSLVEEDLVSVLSGLLDDISPENYVGKRPPEKSYEEEIKDLDLFAFKVQSSWFRCRVYLKFTLTGGDLWLVSLHQDREK